MLKVGNIVSTLFWAEVQINAIKKEKKQLYDQGRKDGKKEYKKEYEQEIFVMPSLPSQDPFHWLCASNRIALVVSILAALTFWESRPFAGKFILKAIPVLALALLVWNHKRSRQEIFLFIALLFHSAGDVLLEIARVRLFLPAVGAFMLGHIFYILAFKADISPNLTLSSTKFFFVIGIIIFTIGMGAVTVPHLEASIVVPVVLYMIVICTMVISAHLANYRTAWIGAGAISYLLSDALIALNTFVQPFAASVYLIWPLYYLGQFLIVIGFLREKAKV